MSKLKNHAAVDLQRFVQPPEPVREVVRSVSFRVRYHEAINLLCNVASILIFVTGSSRVLTDHRGFIVRIAVVVSKSWR